MKWPKVVAWCRWRYFDRSFTAFVAAAAIVQAVTSFYEWQANEKQWQSMQAQNAAINKQLDIMKLDQRPWLSVDPPRIDPPKAGEPIKAVIVAKNTGKTPATIIKRYRIHAFPKAAVKDEVILGREFPTYDLGIGDYDDILKEMERFYSDEEEEFIVPAGESLAFPEETPAFAASEQAIKDIAEGKTMLILLCYIQYRDTRGDEHVTWACFQYAPSCGTCGRWGKYNHMD
jgi:hypothetical protein